MGVSPGKKQMNVYVPEDIDAYVESFENSLGISKSDFVFLLASYSRKFFSVDDIRRLSGDMMVFGEDGLQKV